MMIQSVIIILCTQTPYRPTNLIKIQVLSIIEDPQYKDTWERVD